MHPNDREVEPSCSHLICPSDAFGTSSPKRRRGDASTQFTWYNIVMLNVQEIKTKIKGEISNSKEDLEKYSHDASIFEVVPELVVHPKDVADIQALVKYVAGQKSTNPSLSITARSAGTDMSGGVLNDSIILDVTTHINRLIDLQVNLSRPDKIGTLSPRLGERNIDGFASVEPGMFYRDFEKATLARNLILPCYTASKSLNTVGGMAANNSAGEKTLSMGQTKDYVEELDVVLSDGSQVTFKELDEHELNQKLKLSTFEGEIYRRMYQLISKNNQLIQKAKPTTSKNSAGYLLWEVWDKVRFNLAKLIVGSQGTLGIITKIKYRLVKPKPKSELLVMFLKDLRPLGDIVDTVVKYHPESFESFDDHTFSMAIRFLPGMIKKMKGNIFRLGLQFLPELWMTITGGVPKLILIAEFTGETEEEVAVSLLKAQRDVEEKFKIKTHITRSPEETQKYWTIRRESFSLLRQHVSGLHTAPFIDDIVVHPHDLPEFLPRLNKILERYPSLIYTIAGHAGDANFHIIPLMNLANEKERQIIPKLSDEVYNLVLQYKGSITAEHNDGLIRTPYLEKMFGREVTDLFKQTKQIFDPQNIFNPRKKVGGNINYALEHIKHK